MEEILKHTPIWVFFILIALLYLGYIQSKTRTVTIRRAIVIPIAMTGLSLYGIESAFGASILGFSSWIAGVILAQLINNVLRQPAGVHYISDSKCFVIPGSYIPFMLMMAIFFTKYFISAAIAMRFISPDLPAFIGISSLFLGLFSGAFISRARVVVATRSGRTYPA